MGLPGSASDEFPLNKKRTAGRPGVVLPNVSALLVPLIRFGLVLRVLLAVLRRRAGLAALHFAPAAGSRWWTRCRAFYARRLWSRARIAGASNRRTLISATLESCRT